MTLRAIADTHAVVWFLAADARLSEPARQAMTVEGDQRIGVSVVSVAELVYLEEKGRIAPGTVEAVLSILRDVRSGFHPLALDIAAVAAVPSIPRQQVPDFPDRLIAATALAHGVPLVTADERIRASAVPTIW